MGAIGHLAMRGVQNEHEHESYRQQCDSPHACGLPKKADAKRERKNARGEERGFPRGLVAHKHADVLVGILAAKPDHVAKGSKRYGRQKCKGDHSVSAARYEH